MSDFNKVPLANLADYINGMAFKPDDFTDSGLPVIRIEQLKNRKASFDLYDKPVAARNRIHDGDLIFSWSASLFLQIWDRGPAILNQHLFRVDPKPDVDKLFLKYRIEQSLPDLVNASHGSTMQHITRKELDKCIVNFPNSKAQQAKIAQVLATLDRAIAQTDALLAKQQRVKAGLMQELLTRGIDADGNRRDPRTHAFKDSPLGPIPVEWELKSIGEIAPFVGSGVTPTGGSNVYVDAGVQFLRSQNIHFGGLKLDDVAYISDTTDTAMKRSRVHPFDVLLNITGASIGRCCYYPLEQGRANVNQHVCIIRQDNISESMAIFLSAFLASEYGQRQIKALNAGGNREGLNYQQVRAMTLAYPTLPEQEQIATVVVKAAEASKTLSWQTRKLHSLKAGLMQDLLTGRVSVLPLLHESKQI